MERAVALLVQHRADGDAQTLPADHRDGLARSAPAAEELQREPDQWFWALEAITRENPVPAEAAGK
jgi:hypothetical protein